MLNLATSIICTCALLLLIVSCIAGSKASRLLYGGSAARLNRKVRKQIVWAAYVSLPMVVIIAVTAIIPPSMTPTLWAERVLIFLPLVLVQLLAIWLVAVPKLWRLWKATYRANVAPLPKEIRKQAANPMIIAPFQMSALSAGAIVYRLLLTPVPPQLLKTIVLISIWAAAIALLWFVHGRRWQKVGHSEAVLQFRLWQRAFRKLEMFWHSRGWS